MRAPKPSFCNVPLRSSLRTLVAKAMAPVVTLANGQKSVLRPIQVTSITRLSR